jgi:shikimate dehydrogenase
MLANSNKNLSSVMLEMRALAVGLIAITMPFKENILSYLDEMTDEVRQVGAANTVIRRDDKLFGYNTDVDGIEYALRSLFLSNKNVLIIGAGGAARAAGYYLQQKKSHLFWLNRTEEHTLPLIKKFGGNSVDRKDIDDLPLDIIIHATPLGMFPEIDASPLLNYQFKRNQFVFDMVYRPPNTALLKKAKLHGAACISGLDMFIGQGLKQIEIWLNKPILKAELFDLIKVKIEKQQTSSEERL